MSMESRQRKKNICRKKSASSPVTANRQKSWKSLSRIPRPRPRVRMVATMMIDSDAEKN